MTDLRLREFEELVLLGVLMEGDDACAVTIQQAVDLEAGRGVSLGAIYTALDRLAREGLVESWLGEPTPVRGGRRKRHYRITPAGLEQLAEVWQTRERMWQQAGPGRVKQEATR